MVNHASYGSSPVYTSVLLAVFAGAVMVMLTIAGCSNKPLIFEQKKPESVASMLEKKARNEKADSIEALDDLTLEKLCVARESKLKQAKLVTPKPLTSRKAAKKTTALEQTVVKADVNSEKHLMNHSERPEQKNQQFIDNNSNPAPGIKNEQLPEPPSQDKTDGPSPFPLMPGEDQIKSVLKNSLPQSGVTLIERKDVSIDGLYMDYPSVGSVPNQRPNPATLAVKQEVFDARFTQDDSGREETSGSMGRVVRIKKMITGSGGNLVSPNLKPITDSVLVNTPQ